MQKKLKHQVEAIAVLTNQRVLIGTDQSLRIWNLETKEFLSVENSNGHKDWLRTFVVLEEGLVASGGDDKEIRVWNVTTQRMKKILTDHQGPVYSLISFRDGKGAENLVSGSLDRTMIIWQAFRIVKQLLAHSGVYSMAMLPNGDLASSGVGVIQIWDGRNGFTLKKNLNLNEDSKIWSVASLESVFLVGAGADKTIRIWDVEKGVVAQSLDGHKSQIKSIVVLPNGDIVSGSEDGQLGVWILKKDNV